jgi:hypothetical protein
MNTPVRALGMEHFTCRAHSLTIHDPASPRKTRGGRERAAMEFLKNGSGRVSGEWINDRDR